LRSPLAPALALRVACIQSRHGPDWPANEATLSRLLREAADRGARLAVLPEYAWASMPSEARAGEDPDLPPRAEQVRAFLARESRDLGLAVAGNVIEGGRNVGVAYDGGRSVLEQAKLHPMPREASRGIVGVDAFGVAPVLGRTMAMVVCADVLFPEVARLAQLLDAEVLINPVLSAFEEEDPTREARQALYVARAYDARAFVVKAGGFLPRVIVGRSLVAAPWGIVARQRDEWGEEALVADLDFAKLDAFRKHQERFPPRRPSAYRPLADDAAGTDGA
jgi:nitrilase